MIDLEREIDDATVLREFVSEALDAAAADAGLEVDVRSFVDAGVLTLNEGIVVTSTTADGTRHEFQLTIVRSR